MNKYYRFMACAVVMPALIFALAGCNPSQLVSQNQEIDIGRQASHEIESKYKVVNDPALQARVNEMGQALAKCSDRTNIVYTFKVYKGLINETKGKPDELAGVIAHEIGHVAARHHATMLGRQIQANILLGTLTKGDVQQIAGIFADITLLRYSRVQEYEADKLGIKFMYRCKQWNAQGLIDFFGALLKLEKNKPSQFEQIFRTHPVTQERIKRAQTYLDDLRSGKQSSD
jgi:predicted Zn-dependent protease